MIPALREVGYTDDGCTAYECLMCGAGFDMRNSPIFYHAPGDENARVLKWLGCPVCGEAWEEYITSMPTSNRARWWDSDRYRDVYRSHRKEAEYLIETLSPRMRELADSPEIAWHHERTCAISELRSWVGFYRGERAFAHQRWEKEMLVRFTRVKEVELSPELQHHHRALGLTTTG